MDFSSHLKGIFAGMENDVIKPKDVQQTKENMSNSYELLTYERYL